MRADEFVIYEDAELLVLRKPAGLAVQSASVGQKDLESMVKTWLYEKNGKANPYLGLIHRLDQPVQGLVVFALTPKAAASLSAQVQDGRMKKQYLAVVQGSPLREEGTLTHFLKKNGRDNRSEAVKPEIPGAKKAILQYRVLGKALMEKTLTLLQVTLLTGRHHQIRVQLAAEGMPIYGDQKYNPAAQKGEQIALCASHLELRHPGTGKKMCFNCQPWGGAFAHFQIPWPVGKNGDGSGNKMEAKRFLNGSAVQC